MTSNDSHDAELALAWDDFCDRLRSAKEVVFRDNAAATPQDRAAGLRMLARNIALALDIQYENNDPLRPELTHYFDWRRKQGGDNADALYLGAAIDGAQTYRISGVLGSAAFVAFTVIDAGATPWGGAASATILARDLQADADGRFELRLSPTPQPGNWLRTSEKTIRVTIRQFFGDWENEQPLTAHIERLGDALPPPGLSVESLTAGLRRSADWLGDVSRYWHNTLTLWQQRPLEFLSFRQLTHNGIDATPGGEPFLAYWQLQTDEALIIRVRPPTQYSFWNFEFGNWWMETMDYRHRLSGTNHHHAVLEDDGELILVVSQDDPGVPNWLDASGYSAGYLVCRWMGASSAPQPTMRRVARSELFAQLPPSVKRIDAHGRQQQLAARRRGISKRFAGI
ncbi:DUF1214 domain-containing protein [Solimonas soli]|uniref:DUF1214 domain-containing protein n=1 Tax=Solimonas soli TaxID=413479 RepID=UPI000489EB30|nr:DUF1214 domain-containing protein [Solimonas soli]